MAPRTGQIVEPPEQGREAMWVLGEGTPLEFPWGKAAPDNSVPWIAQSKDLTGPLGARPPGRPVHSALEAPGATRAPALSVVPDGPHADHRQGRPALS